MIVAISRAHGGKTPDTDVGSVSDADGDGHIAYDEREEFLAGIFSQGLESQLRALGHEVFVYGAGDYGARAKEMRKLPTPPHVILYPHLDVRVKPNPLFFYDAASTNGSALASNVSRCVNLAFPELGTPRFGPATKTSSPGGERICLLHRADRGVVLVMETFTTVMAASWADQGKLDQLTRAGAAAADGVHRWGQQRGLVPVSQEGGAGAVIQPAAPPA